MHRTLRDSERDVCYWRNNMPLLCTSNIYYVSIFCPICQKGFHPNEGYTYLCFWILLIKYRNPHNQTSCSNCTTDSNWVLTWVQTAYNIIKKYLYCSYCSLSRTEFVLGGGKYKIQQVFNIKIFGNTEGILTGTTKIVCYLRVYAILFFETIVLYEYWYF